MQVADIAIRTPAPPLNVVDVVATQQSWILVIYKIMLKCRNFVSRTLLSRAEI